MEIERKALSTIHPNIPAFNRKVFKMPYNQAELKGLCLGKENICHSNQQIKLNFSSESTAKFIKEGKMNNEIEEFQIFLDSKNENIEFFEDADFYEENPPSVISQSMELFEFIPEKYQPTKSNFIVESNQNQRVLFSAKFNQQELTLLYPGDSRIGSYSFNLLKFFQWKKLATHQQHQQIQILTERSKQIQDIITHCDESYWDRILIFMSVQLYDQFLSHRQTSLTFEERKQLGLTCLFHCYQLKLRKKKETNQENILTLSDFAEEALLQESQKNTMRNLLHKITDFRACFMNPQPYLALLFSKNSEIYHNIFKKHVTKDSENLFEKTQLLTTSICEISQFQEFSSLYWPALISISSFIAALEIQSQAKVALVVLKEVLGKNCFDRQFCFPEQLVLKVAQKIVKWLLLCFVLKKKLFSYFQTMYNQSCHGYLTQTVQNYAHFNKKLRDLPIYVNQ